MVNKLNRKKIKRHRCISVSFLNFLSVLIFLGSINCLNAQNMLKQKYDINDPRNPDCPCHKMQRIADKEYKDHLNTSDNGLFPLNNHKREDRKFYSAVVKKKKKTAIYTRLLFRLKNKMKKGKKIRPDYSVCYKW